MSYFGTYLLKCGALERSESEDALQARVVYGGRLGTNLLELGYLPLDDLARLLAEYTGAPLAPAALLIEPSAEALRTIPVDLARRYKAFAFEIRGTKLHAAMLDPSDEAQIAKLAEVTGFSVKAFTVPEVLLHALLERHMGIRPERRFAQLAKTLHAREKARPKPKVPAKPPEPASDVASSAKGQPAGPRPEAVPAPLAEGEELIDEKSFAKLHEDLVAGTRKGDEEEGTISDEILLDEVAPDAMGENSAVPFEDPPTDPGEITRIETRIGGAADRDEIAALAVRLARTYTRTAALFLVQGGTMAGFRGDSSDLERRIQGIVIPLQAECRFAQVATTLEPWRGEPPTDGLDARILRALGRERSNEILLLPICIRNRVVNVLYADNGHDVIAETSMAALAALCNCVSRSYQRLIMASKRSEQLGG